MKGLRRMAVDEMSVFVVCMLLTFESLVVTLVPQNLALNILRSTHRLDLCVLYASQDIDYFPVQ
jgi:hypothetical protein